jgi:predicted nucleic acid-binding protein
MGKIGAGSMRTNNARARRSSPKSLPLYSGSHSVATKPMTPAAVFDTHVLLDWWLFRDPRITPWRQAVLAGSVRMLICPLARVELVRMLGHASLAHWPADRGAALAEIDRLAEQRSDPPSSGPGLRCRDPDDQVFVDLALGGGARWLLTRDRALLALARRARPLGLQIGAPEHLAP